MRLGLGLRLGFGFGFGFGRNGPLRPRKPKERLETPPEILAPGRFVVIHLVASMKSLPA